MYTIANINTYFENTAHSLKYVNHTIGGTKNANRYARFNDEETMTAILGNMGFPRLVLSGLPSGSMSGNSSTIFDKLSMALEISNTCKKDDFNAEMQIWDDTRLAIDQIVARIQKNKADGSDCDELEKRFDFNSIRYELFKTVDATGVTVGTRMSFSLASSLPAFDDTAWQ